MFGAPSGLWFRKFYMIWRINAFKTSRDQLRDRTLDVNETLKTSRRKPGARAARARGGGGAWLRPLICRQNGPKAGGAETW